MSLHESRRSPACRIDDVQLLQGLLTQRLYVNEQDRRLLRVLLAEAPRQQRTLSRASRRGGRRLHAGGAALALGGALVLALASPLLPAVAASPPPATWIAVTDRAANNLAAADQSDALLRALLNRTATVSQVVAPTGEAADKASDALLRALLNHTATASQAVTSAEQSDALLRALLNRTATVSQAVTSAAQTLPQADEAFAQAELIAGETLVIPAAHAADAISAAPLDSIEQQAVSYYVVQPGDTLSGIALAFYGNGNLWPTIFNANTDKIADPHWIYPNQQRVIPAGGYVIQTYATPARAIASNAKYTVQSGDTLSGIAYAAYGDGTAWWGIFQANTDKIYNPDLIYPGQVLAIP